MNEHQAVLEVVNDYLRSIYEGDTGGLTAVFLPSARVEDTATGTFRSRSAAEYIQAVGSRQSPRDAGEPFTMAPVSIHLIGTMASAVAELKFLGQHFFNVLSLIRVDGQWRIAHKLFGPPQA